MEPKWFGEAVSEERLWLMLETMSCKVNCLVSVLTEVGSEREIIMRIHIVMHLLQI